jgi:hypothetical protein
MKTLGRSRPSFALLLSTLLLSALLSSVFAVASKPPKASPGRSPHLNTSLDTTFAQLVSAIDARAKALENSSGMKRGFDFFTAEYKIEPASIRYSDYVVARLVYESTRDAGFWGMHWSITNEPPNSDLIWRQWSAVKSPSFTAQTATAECDELSALYALIARRAGVRGIGLFWPYPNHTVAVWTLHPAANSYVRVVVPTSQIFLTEADDFGTKSFNPWTQKTIYEYTRRDVPDDFELPKPLFDFFVSQLEKYGGASDAVLQKIRYMRDAVFRGEWVPEDAARAALALRASLASAPPEDSAALQDFVQDMRSPMSH